MPTCCRKLRDGWCLISWFVERAARRVLFKEQCIIHASLVMLSPFMCTRNVMTPQHAMQLFARATANCLPPPLLLPIMATHVTAKEGRPATYPPPRCCEENTGTSRHKVSMALALALANARPSPSALRPSPTSPIACCHAPSFQGNTRRRGLPRRDAASDPARGCAARV